jgi:hypothetical protein
LEAPASSTPVVLQLQQTAPLVLQPAQQQQVYTLPSGEQLLLGGTPAGAMQQQHTPGAYVGNTAAVSADGAGGRLVLAQPLQAAQSSYCSTGTGQHTQVCQCQNHKQHTRHVDLQNCPTCSKLDKT